MVIDNSVVKLNISDIRKKFKCYSGIKLEIFLDMDVVIKHSVISTKGETQGGKE